MGHGSTAFTVFDHDQVFMDWITATTNQKPVGYGNYGFAEKTDYEQTADRIEKLQAYENSYYKTIIKNSLNDNSLSAYTLTHRVLSSKISRFNACSSEEIKRNKNLME